MGVFVNADLTQINLLGNYLVSEANEFGRIISKIRTISDQLENGWQGIDATKFIENLNSYIENLEEIRKYIEVLGKSILKYHSKYSNILFKYYESIKEA